MVTLPAKQLRSFVAFALATTPTIVLASPGSNRESQNTALELQFFDRGTLADSEVSTVSLALQHLPICGTMPQGGAVRACSPTD